MRASPLVRSILALILISYLADALALFDHNEQMYLTAARLVADGMTIYRDFSFAQTPYWPVLLSLPARMVPPDFLLPAGRILVLAILAVGAYVLRRELVRTSSAPGIASALTILFLVNEHVAQIGRDTSNYALPMVATLGAHHLLGAGRRPVASPVLAGALLALAVGSKAYFGALVLALLFGHGLWGEGTREERRRRVGYCVAGGVAGALPLIVVAIVDWPRFLFNNVEYHRVDFTWKIEHAQAMGVGLAGKLGKAVQDFGSLSIVEFLLLSTVLIALTGGVTRGARTPLLVAATGLVVSILGTPVFPQYYSMAIPFLALSVGALAGSRELAVSVARSTVLATVVLATVLQLPRIGNSILRLGKPGSWAVTEVVATGTAIRVALPNHDPGERILTLAPVHALAAGFAIYPELAAGPFFFRNAGSIPVEDQRRWVMTGPTRLPELIADRAPAGIYVGHEPELDGSLEALAESLDFRPVPAGRGTLWVRR